MTNARKQLEAKRTKRGKLVAEQRITGCRSCAASVDKRGRVVVSVPDHRYTGSNMRHLDLNVDEAIALRDCLVAILSEGGENE